MLDWLWKGIAAVAGLAALVFGVNAARTKQRMKQEEFERKAAMDRMVNQAYRDLIETHKRHAEKAPIDAKKRTDFEGGR